MPPPRALAVPLVALAVALAGCGGASGRAAAQRPAEVLIEVLPRSARIELDGRLLGRGGAIAAPAPAEAHRLRVSAEGFVPVERSLPAEALEGARIGAALRPQGFDGARALDYDDAAGLALAAAWLAERGQARDAAEYAERAVAVDPAVALAHRALGDARARLGAPGAAAASWAEYLRLAPDAADAAEVKLRMEAAREARTP